MLTDAQDNKAVAAAESLRAELGDGICVIVIIAGDEDATSIIKGTHISGAVAREAMLGCQQAARSIMHAMMED